MGDRIEVMCFLHKVVRWQDMQLFPRVGFRIKYEIVAAT